MVMSCALVGASEQRRDDESCGNDPLVRCEEKLNCFETCGASGRRFLFVAASAYSAWEANIIGMVGPGDDST